MARDASRGGRIEDAGQPTPRPFGMRRCTPALPVQPHLPIFADIQAEDITASRCSPSDIGPLPLHWKHCAATRGRLCNRGHHPDMSCASERRGKTAKRSPMHPATSFARATPPAWRCFIHRSIVVTWSALVMLACCTSAVSAAQPPPENSLWNAEGTAAAVASPGESGTQVTAFLGQQDGSFRKIDLSAVENSNFGKLGRRRTEYERFETTPIRWIPRPDDLLQIEIQTRAWHGGQRYTVSEPVLLRRDGTVLWR